MVSVAGLAHDERIRPVMSGLGEGALHSSYTPIGTNGILMRVTNPQIAHGSIVSGSRHEAGQLIRVSTNRVYSGVATSGETSPVPIGTQITQPKTGSGTEIGNSVGQLVAYVPLANDLTVDVAARTATFNYETPAIHSIPGTWGVSELNGVRRDISTLNGEEVLRVGLDSGDGDEVLTVLSENTSATITYQIDSSGTTQNISLVSQIATETPANADSSSAGSVVIDGDGQLVGLWVGKNQSGNGVVTPVYALERALGAKVITNLRLTVLDNNLEQQMVSGEPQEFVAPPDETPSGQG